MDQVPHDDRRRADGLLDPRRPGDQLVANVGAILTEDESGLGISTAQVGPLASVHLVGQVVRALVFGRLTDRLGRRKLFILTLAIYLIGSGLTGVSWDLYSFLFLRFVAGMGIGGSTRRSTPRSTS